MNNYKIVNNYRIAGLNWLLWRWFNLDLITFNKACLYQGVFNYKDTLNWLKKGKLGGNLSYKKQFIKAYSNLIKDMNYEN